MGQPSGLNSDEWNVAESCCMASKAWPERWPSSSLVRSGHLLLEPSHLEKPGICVLAHSPIGPRHQSKPPPEMEGGRLQACPGCSHRRAPRARTTSWIPGMVRNNNLKKVVFLLTKFRPVCCIGVVTEILCYYVTQSSRCYEGYKKRGFFSEALQILKRHIWK